MKVLNINSVEKRVADHPLFTGGPVSTQFLVTRSMGKNYNVIVVNFSKGARTKFHSHDCDQLLVVTAGKGIVATNGEEHQVGAGDVVLIPAGEKHRHGATKDSDFAHISVEAKGSEHKQLED